MTITRDDVLKWKPGLKLHMKLQNGSHFQYGFEENPRLEVVKRREGDVHSTTWYVDGVPVSGGLDRAIEALNTPRLEPARVQYPVFKLADCAAREVKKRREVYPRLIEKQKLDKKRAQEEIAMMMEISRLFTMALQHVKDNDEDLFGGV